MIPQLPPLPEPASGAQYDLHTLNRYDERTLRAWARAYGLACIEACAMIAEDALCSAFSVAAHVAIREAAKEIGSTSAPPRSP